MAIVFTGQLPFLSLDQWCQSTEGRSHKLMAYDKIIQSTMSSVECHTVKCLQVHMSEASSIELLNNKWKATFLYSISPKFREICN